MSAAFIAFALVAPAVLLWLVNNWKVEVGRESQTAYRIYKNEYGNFVPQFNIVTTYKYFYGKRSQVEMWWSWYDYHYRSSLEHSTKTIEEAQAFIREKHRKHCEYLQHKIEWAEQAKQAGVVWEGIEAPPKASHLTRVK